MKWYELLALVAGAITIYSFLKKNGGLGLFSKDVFVYDPRTTFESPEVYYPLGKEHPWLRYQPYGPEQIEWYRQFYAERGIFPVVGGP